MQVADELGRGLCRKTIAFAHGLSQSSITAIKQRFPLLSWSPNKDPQDEFKF